MENPTLMMSLVLLQGKKIIQLPSFALMDGVLNAAGFHSLGPNQVQTDEFRPICNEVLLWAEPASALRH